MKEIIQALSDELKRLRSEGQEALPIDESSLEALANFAGSSQGREVLETPKKIEFAKEVNFVPEEIKEEKAPMRKARIVSPKTADIESAPIPPPTPFALPEGDKQTRWNFLQNIVLNDEVCKAHLRPKKQIVFGVGNLDADVFFCGEAPGADEEIQGEPFVGKAGQLLTKVIQAMGLERKNVYIGNIMNWRPEMPTSFGNRPPTTEEMAYCLPYLKAQIEIVKPKVIVALGMTAVKGLLGDDPKRRMGNIRGKWTKFDNCDLMITYHPSYILQYATAENKRMLWEDMMMVMERIGLPISPRQRHFFEKA